jgi:hypothetical protein
MGVTNIFNKREAFKKLAETPAFKAWHRLEVAKKLGLEREVDKIVDTMMEERNLKIEGF